MSEPILIYYDDFLLADSLSRSSTETEGCSQRSQQGDRGVQEIEGAGIQVVRIFGTPVALRRYAALAYDLVPTACGNDVQRANYSR